MSDIRTIFKPRRGKKTTFTTGDKSSTILESGEIFFEYPDNGAGTGRGRIMMGDGESTYATMSSNNKYFIPFTEDEIIVHPGTTDKSITSTSISTTTINTYLNNAKSGNTLKSIIHNLREAIYSNACNIENNRSYIGMIIHSTLLDTEAKVIAIYGGTTWLNHSGYMLRGASNNVVANSASKTGGNDNLVVPYHRHSFTPAGTISGGAYTFTGTAKNYTSGNQSANHSHTFTGTSATTEGASQYLTAAQTGGTYAGVQFGMSAMYGDKKGGTPFLGGYPATKHTHTVTAKGTIGNNSANHTHTTSVTPTGTISVKTNPSFSGTAGNTGYEGTSGNTTNANIPNYKSVYIWERTA